MPTTDPTWENCLIETNDFMDCQDDPSSNFIPSLQRWMIAAMLIVYGIIASVMEIRFGFYYIKLIMLGAIFSLILVPANYAFLLGLLVSVYYLLKANQIVTEVQSFQAGFLYIFTIIIALHNGFRSLSGKKRNPYDKMDLPAYCLLGILFMSLCGFWLVENPYLYLKRIVETAGFVCAFFLGKSYLKNLNDLKLLLRGLCLGMFAFVFPWTIGYILNRGLGILGKLDTVREELGSSISQESGSLLLIFVLAFSISGSILPRRVRRFALWLLAIPAAVMLLTLLSRAAILLLPIAIILGLILSGKRAAAVYTIIICGLAGLMISIYAGEIFISIESRLRTFDAASAQRHDIYTWVSGMGLKNPILGIGAGQTRVRTPFFHGHNDAITIFAEYGILALLFYLLFWGAICYYAFRLRLQGTPLIRSLSGTFLLVMFCYIAYAQIETMYFARGGILFTFLMGAMSSFYHQHSAQRMAWGLNISPEDFTAEEEILPQGEINLDLPR